MLAITKRRGNVTSGELIVMLQARFGIRLGGEEMAELRSSDRIEHSIEERHAA